MESEPEDYPFGIRVEAIDPDGNRISLREFRVLSRYSERILPRATPYCVRAAKLPDITEFEHMARLGLAFPVSTQDRCRAELSAASAGSS